MRRLARSLSNAQTTPSLVLWCMVALSWTAALAIIATTRSSSAEPLCDADQTTNPPAAPFERIGPVEGSDGYAEPQFSGDGHAFLAPKYNAGPDHLGMVRVWDARTLKLLGEPLRQKGLTFSGLAADGKTAFTTDDKELLLWDVATAKVRGSASLAGQSDLFVRISPDGTRCLTIPKDDKELTLAVWHVGEPRPRLLLRTPDGAFSGAFDPTGRRIFIDGSDAFYLFDADTGRALGDPVPASLYTYGDHRAAFDRAGRRLLVPQNHGFALIDAATGKVVNQVTVDGQVDHVAFSADNAKVSVTAYAGIRRGPARIYDAATGKFEQEIGTDVAWCTVGPGAQWAWCLPIRDHEADQVEIWDMKSRTCVQRFPGVEGYLSSDGSLLVLQAKSGGMEGWRLTRAYPATRSLK